MKRAALSLGLILAPAWAMAGSPVTICDPTNTYCASPNSSGQFPITGALSIAGTTSNASSGVPTSSTNLPTVSYNYGFNGTTWDQFQVDANKNLKQAPQNVAVGPAAFTPGAVTSVTGVSGSPTLILAARTGAPGTGRVSATIVQSASSVVLFVCSTNNCTAGVRLPATEGASITINTTSALYGYVASGTAAITEYETD